MDVEAGATGFPVFRDFDVDGGVDEQPGNPGQAISEAVIKQKIDGVTGDGTVSTSGASVGAWYLSGTSVFQP